jgi:hypothetical protein
LRFYILESNILYQRGIPGGFRIFDKENIVSKSYPVYQVGLEKIFMIL